MLSRKLGDLRHEAPHGFNFRADLLARKGDGNLLPLLVSELREVIVLYEFILYLPQNIPISTKACALQMAFEKAAIVGYKALRFPGLPIHIQKSDPISGVGISSLLIALHYSPPTM